MYEEPYDTYTVLPPAIKYKFKIAENCAIPACASCLLDRSKKCVPGVNKVNTLPDK